MNLSIRHMKAFSALAATRNFTRAAELCNLSQSAFSALISNLETGLGVKLFSRNTRNVELTEAGKSFNNNVNHLLPEMESMLTEMQDHAQRRKGRIAIAALPSISSSILPNVIARFFADYPGIDLIMQDAANTVCMDLLRNRQVDVALCAWASPSADLIIKKLTSDTFYFVCRANHPLANQKRLSAADVLALPIIVFEEASSIRQHLDASIYPKQWNKAFQVNNLSTAAGFVNSGLGVTIVPTLALFQFNPHGLRAIPIILPINRRDICLIRRKDAADSPAILAFTRLLRESLHSAVQRLAPDQSIHA